MTYSRSPGAIPNEDGMKKPIAANTASQPVAGADADMAVKTARAHAHNLESARLAASVVGDYASITAEPSKVLELLIQHISIDLEGILRFLFYPFLDPLATILAVR